VRSAQVDKLAVDVQLEQGGRVVREPTYCFGHGAVNVGAPPMGSIDERIDNSDRVVLTHSLVWAFLKQARLASIHAFNKAPR
jgi:hypothetical protein